jgi:RES domain-containing protein
MLLYRVTQRAYADLDGSGGLLTSSRWNYKGHRVVYLSENRSLSILEFLVHITGYAFSPLDMVLMTVEVPENITEIEPKTLPEGWEKSNAITRKAGTDFLVQNQSLLFRVPSVIVPLECNFLLNPVHDLAINCKIIEILPLNLDKRILHNI